MEIAAASPAFSVLTELHDDEAEITLEDCHPLQDHDCYEIYDNHMTNPRLWGPVTNFTMFKEYVRLYNERYTCYSSIRKTLEQIINEFREVKEKERQATIEMNHVALNELRKAAIKRHAEVEKIFTHRKKVYIFLHKELETFKAHIYEYYNKMHSKGRPRDKPVHDEEANI